MPNDFAGSVPHHLTVRDIVKLSTRSFAAKPTRTLLTVLGTSIGIATVVVLVSLGYGLQGILLGKLITTNESLITLNASYPAETNATIDPAQAGAIAKKADVVAVSPSAEFSGEIKAGSLPPALSLVRIVDEKYFPLSGQVPDIGAVFGNGAGLVISSQALRLLDLPVSKSSLGTPVAVTAYYQGKNESSTYAVSSNAPVAVSGILTDDTQPPVVIVSKDAFKKPPPVYKEIYAEAKSADVLEALRTDLINQGFVISAHIDLVRQAQQVTNIITIVLGVFGVAALTVSAIGMFNTMIVGFLERTYEVGVMKALGATDADVKKLFLMESVIMGLAGGVMGIAIGVGLSQLFNLGVSLLAARLGGKPFILFVSPLWFLGVVIGVSAVIGLAAGFIPARRASSLSPKEAFIRK